MCEDPGRAVAIFTEALQVPTAERRAFLDRACAGDDELRRKVEELLRAQERLGDFMEKPADDPGFPVNLDPSIDGEPPAPDANGGDSTNK